MKTKTANFSIDYETGIVKRNGRKYGLIKEVDGDTINVLVTQKSAKAFGEIMTFIVVLPEGDENDGQGND
jgi:hypothetical protein